MSPKVTMIDYLNVLKKAVDLNLKSLLTVERTLALKDVSKEEIDLARQVVKGVREANTLISKAIDTQIQNAYNKN